MLIGINWTGSHADIALLEDWRKVLRLAPKLRVTHMQTGQKKWLYLRGIADKRDVQDAITVASNGRRVIKMIERDKKVQHGKYHAYYGIYTD